MATFERIGARRDAERAGELLGRQQTTRTFLFTDIVGSTKLLETLGNDKWKKLLARHNDVVREQIVERGGEVAQQTGDGFFAVFATARSAIEAAIAIQRALDAEIVAPDVRIGAHTGAGFEEDGGSNRYGGRLSPCGEISAAAGAHEILVSRETLECSGPRLRLLSRAPRAGFRQPSTSSPWTGARSAGPQMRDPEPDERSRSPSASRRYQRLRRSHTWRAGGRRPSVSDEARYDEDQAEGEICSVFAPASGSTTAAERDEEERRLRVQRVDDHPSVKRRLRRSR
jgi:class 3 adenylate cyclase